MKKIVVLCLTVLAMFGLSLYDFPFNTGSKVEQVAATSTATPKENKEKKAEAGSMKAEDVLKAQYEEMYRCLIGKNIEKLDAVMAEEYVLVHMTGIREGKKDYLEGVKSGRFNYLSEKTHKVVVKVQGNKAQLIGQSEVAAAVYGGRERSWPLQIIIDFKKENGKWLQTLCTASTY